MFRFDARLLFFVSVVWNLWKCLLVHRECQEECAALLRPGRFDGKVIVDRPDVAGKEEILAILARNKPLGDVDVGILARRTTGFTGADLENLLNSSSDEEVRQLVEGCYDTALSVVNEHRDKLEAVVVALKEKKTLNKEQFEAIMQGEVEETA